MRGYLRTAVAGGATIGLTGVGSVVASALSLLDERAPDPVIRLWARTCLRASQVRTQARGLERLPAGNFVLVVNHLSNFDVLVVLANVDRHLRFVAKRELRRIPIFGFALERIGNVFVDRTGSASDRERLHDAARAVRERVSVVFFGEGTRSTDGVLRPFKKGAAVMAIEAQVPLVPAAVAGTHLILPKGSLVIQPRPAALVIGEPIETAGLSLDARDALTGRAHAEVARRLDEANALLREMGG